MKPTSSKSPATPEFLVAIGTSAGGLRALREVLSRLPATFPAAVVIVQHMMPDRPNLLAGLLKPHCALPVVEATAGVRLRPGRVYIGCPNFHVLVNQKKKLSLSSGKKVNFTRPSADALFESVAASFGTHAIAVVLTGCGVDGAAGAVTVKRLGGHVICQDRATSEQFGMPGAAADTGAADFVLPLNDIAGTLCRMVEENNQAP